MMKFSVSSALMETLSLFRKTSYIVLEERERNRETEGIDEDKNEEDVCEEEQQKLCRLLEAVDVTCSV